MLDPFRTPVPLIFSTQLLEKDSCPPLACVELYEPHQHSATHRGRGEYLPKDGDLVTRINPMRVIGNRSELFNLTL
jgi:hypothetical protein